METILFLAYTEPNGTLGSPAVEALGAATALVANLPGSNLVTGLFGEVVSPAADSIANCGARNSLGLTGADFAQSRYATDAAAAEALWRAAQASVVIAAATCRFNRVLAGVAQRVGGRADTHVTGISVSDGAVSVTRWYYRQRMEGVLRRSNRPWFILVEPGTQSPWQGTPGSARLDTVTLNPSENCRRTTVTSVREPALNAQTIRPEANLLLVAGAGWTKKQADNQPHVPEAEKLLRDCLQLARASLGSSKSLVDLGGEGQAVLSFLTHMNQVGQTGSTPRHPKGLATCCHGEEPHTVGWRFIAQRRAINLDPNCGWARGKADVLYVADAFAVIRKVNELLAQQASADP